MKKSGLKWRSLRLLSLFLAFLLIAAAPVLNSRFHFSFVQGWYQSISVGALWFVSPLEGLESILTSRMLYAPLIVGMTIPLVIAFLLGRVFCAWVCPVSFLSEITDWCVRLLTRRKYRTSRISLPRRIFWAVLPLELCLAMTVGVPIFVFLSPPGLIGREIMMAVMFKTLAVEGVVVLAVIVMHLFTPRFFCRYLCPLGSLLGVAGSRRRLYVQLETECCMECGLCARACPLGLEPEQGDTLSAYCWNCGECVDACGAGALGFRWRAVGLDAGSLKHGPKKMDEGTLSPGPGGSKDETIN